MDEVRVKEPEASLPWEGNAGGFEATVSRFEAALPGWWWSVGNCHVSCHANCGPDSEGPDCHLLTNTTFDNGFHADIDQPATLADALLAVMEQGLAAKAALETSK